MKREGLLQLFRPRLADPVMCEFMIWGFKRIVSRVVMNC
jgi:hypothetical protein